MRRPNAAAALAASTLALVVLAPLAAGRSSDEPSSPNRSGAAPPAQVSAAMSALGPGRAPGRPRPEGDIRPDRSGEAYGAISDSQARDLLRDAFPDSLVGLLADPLAKAELLGFTDDRTALVESAAGDPVLLSSTLPLRAPLRGARGLAPIDLRLSSRGNAFMPANPLVDTTLPRRLASGAELTPEVGLDFGSGSVEGKRLEGAAVFYPNYRRDADLVLAPLRTGLESLTQIRSAAAPQSFATTLELPGGAVLRERGEDGGAEVMADGESILHIYPPSAEDAAGRPVDVEMVAEGDRLSFEVAHRDAGYAYPILLDPVYETYNWRYDPEVPGDQNNNSGLVDWERAQTPGSEYIVRYSCASGAPCYGPRSPEFPAGYPWGLYVYLNEDAPVSFGQTGYFTWQVPHYANTTAYIERFAGQDIFRLYDSENDYGTPHLVAGIMGEADGAPSWTALHIDSTNHASVHGFALLANGGGFAEPATGQEAIFGIYSSVDRTLESFRHAYLGYAVLGLTDPEAPRLLTLVHQGDPSAWTSDDRRRSLLASAADPGLGVHDFELIKGFYVDGAAPGGPPVTHYSSEITPASSPQCAGSRSNPCPQDTGEVEVAYRVSELPEGVSTARLRVRDALAAAEGAKVPSHSATSGVWDLKIDRSGPQLELSGGLYQPGVPGSSVTVAATDGDAGNGANTPTNRRGARSGVASIELMIDGEPFGRQEYPCTRPLGSCAQRKSFDLAGTSFAADDHDYKVIATDHAGNVAVERFSEANDGSPPETGVRQIGLEGWVDDLAVQTLVQARNKGGGVKRIELRLPGPDGDRIAAQDCSDGCPGKAAAAFRYSPRNMPEGIQTATIVVVSGNPAEAPRRESFPIRVDHSAATATFSLRTRTAPAQPGEPEPIEPGDSIDLLTADAAWLSTDALDGDPAGDSSARSGVRLIELLADGSRVGAAADDCPLTSRPRSSCPLRSEVRLSAADFDPALDPNEHELEVVVTDNVADGIDAASDSDPSEYYRATFTVSAAPPERPAQGKLGLEHYFSYDSVEAGVSGLQTNLATGNTVWHAVPILNPGRGLASVLNLTYNTLGETSALPNHPGETNGGLLSSLPYDQAGLGVSIGLSGLSRLNQPLGVPVAGAPATTVRLTDVDGTAHVFSFDEEASAAPVPAAGTGMVFRAPPGVNLRLREYSPLGSELREFRRAQFAEIDPRERVRNRLDHNNNRALDPEERRRAWAITRPDGTSFFYDGWGYERSIVDRNANTIEFEYEHFNPLDGRACPVELVVPGLCELRVIGVVDAAGFDAAAPRETRTIDIDYYPGGRLDGDYEAGKIHWISDHRVIDGQKRRLELSYDSNYGTLTKLSEAAATEQERSTRFAYSEEGADPTEVRQLTAVTDPRGNDTVITPEPPSGQPGRRTIAITNRAGDERIYSYDGADEQAQADPAAPSSATVTDARAVVTRYELDRFDRLGRLSEAVADPAARTSAIGWDADNNVIAVTEAVGEPEEATTKWSYNDNGALIAELDPLNRQSTLAYCDHAGTMRSGYGTDQRGGFVSDVIVASPPRANDTTYEYGHLRREAGQSDDSYCEAVKADSRRGNLTAAIDPAGGRWRTVYDPTGQVIAEINAEGEKTTYGQYDPSGLPRLIVTPRGNAPHTNALRHRWIYQYDRVGNVLAVTDPRGAEQARFPGSLPGSGDPYTSSLGYDAFDRLVSERIPKCSSAAACGRVEFVRRWRRFDANGNVVLSTDAEGHSTASTYNPMDRPLALTDARGVSVDGSGNVSTDPRYTSGYEYDAEQGLVRITAPKGFVTPSPSDFATSFELDPLGRRLAAIRTTAGSQRLITSYAYDHRDRVIGVALPKNNSSKSAGEWTSDSLRRAIINATTESGRRYQYSYDAASNLVGSVENPDGGCGAGFPEDEQAYRLETQYRYDQNDNLIAELAPRGFCENDRDPGDFATVMTYDERDLPVETIDPLRHITTTSYDRVGRVVAVETPGGPNTEVAGDFTTTYRYDQNGYLISRSIPWADGQYGLTAKKLRSWKVSYGRDAVGNPIEITDARGNYAKAEGKPALYRAHSFKNRFFDSGMLAATRRPSWWGLDWSSPHGSPGAGRAYQEQASGGAVPDLMIPPGGPVIAENPGGGSGGGGSLGLPGPGDFGGVAPQGLPGQLAAAGLVELRYDAEMRLRQITPAKIGNSERSRTIAYDAIGQITEKRWPRGFGVAPSTHRYQYDPDGNLTAYTNGRGHLTSFAYDGFDRRASESAPGSYSSPGDADYDAEITRYGYDPNGMLERRTTPEGTSFNFTYDGLDRLRTESNPKDETWLYAYDAAGATTAEIGPRASLSPDPSAATSPRLFETTYSYDTAQRLSEIHAPEERDSYLSYDNEDNLTKLNSPGTEGDDARRISTTSYDARGLPWQTTIAAGTPEARTTVTEYDPDANLIRTVNPKGVDPETALPYKRLDPLKAAYDPSIGFDHANTAALSAPTRHATVNVIDPDGLVRDVYLPHAIGAAVEPRRADRRYRQRFHYDRRGEVAAIDSAYDFQARHGAFAGKTRRTAYTYLETGWIKSQTDSKLVNPTQSGAGLHDTEVRYGYDPEGNQRSWITEGFFNSSARPEKGRKITRSFYPSGMLASRTGKKHTDPDTVASRSYSYFYNQNRSLIETYDSFPDYFDAIPGSAKVEQRTKITRDDAERERFVDERWRGGTDTGFGYDAAGNLTTRRSAGEFQTHSGDPCDPSSGSPTCSYAEGLTTSFSYDHAERETKTCVNDATGAAAETETATGGDSCERSWATTWFGSDQLRSRERSNGVTETRAYLPTAMLSKRTRSGPSGSETQGYSYDRNLNRTADERGYHAFNARDQLTRWYRPASRPGEATEVSFSDPGAMDLSGSTTYNLDATGQTLSSHATERFTIDENATATTITTDSAYDYTDPKSSDRDGSLSSVRTQISATGPSAPPDTTTTDRFYYDDLGNTTRIRHDRPDGGRPGQKPPQSAECDSSAWKDTRGSTYYCFDEFSRLVATAGPDSRPASSNDGVEIYISDGLDRRQLVISFDRGTTHVLERGYIGTTELLASERTRDPETGELASARYDYDSQGLRLGRSEASRTGEGATYSFYAHDANGSVELLEDEDGTVASEDGVEARYSYDPYGNAEHPDPTNPDLIDKSPEQALPEIAQDNRFRFEGFYYDSGIASYDMQAREYRPDLGRFLSQDRFEAAGLDLTLQSDPLTQNRYAFAGGNPVSNIEWDGHHERAGRTENGIERSAQLIENGHLRRGVTVMVATIQALVAHLERHSVQADAIATIEATGVYQAASEESHAGVAALSATVANNRELRGMAETFAGLQDQADTAEEVANYGVCDNLPWIGGVIEGACNLVDPDFVEAAYKGDFANAAIGAIGIIPVGKGFKALKGLRRGASSVDEGAALVDDLVAAACSFSGATPVLMADGSKLAIRKIRAGDRVLATDPLSGETRIRKVTRVWVHRDRVVRFGLADGFIWTTPDHPFWDAGAEAWRRARALGAGDLALSADGRRVRVDGLLGDRVREVAAYNLTVRGIHTYHVGQAALLVHNTCVVGGVAARGADDLVDLASTARRRHILYGDKTGGGHLYPGLPSKTPFPRGWDADRIMHEISDVATDPASQVLRQSGGRTVLQGTRGGVDIRVVTDGSDIITGYPTNLSRNP